MHAQGCCSGGTGSPITGEAATGVLNERQFEIAVNYQYFRSDKFFAGDRDTIAQFDNLRSDYLYLRADYGLSNRLTFSLATGYFLDKTLVELHKANTISFAGIGDLIVFPRYNLVNKETRTGRTEVTLGLGYKIPLGAHDNTHLVFSDPVTGTNYYTTSPPTVQPTNGSHDLFFFSFVYKDYPFRKLRFFASGLYVKKGWNSLGEKFGDYGSLSLYAGKTVFKKWGLTAQLKGEWMGKVKAAEGIDLLALYNVDPASTGSWKLFFVPQVSYSFKDFTIYAVSEIPMYQYLEGIQVGSQYQFTAGFSYRFSLNHPLKNEQTPPHHLPGLRE